MEMLKSLAKKVLLKMLPRSVINKLKGLIKFIATWPRLPHLLARQQSEIEELRGDVNRLLSLARLNKFNQLDDTKLARTGEDENII